ncbi:MAG: DUF3489 domain-containing protein [Magnetococcales bacterium]|nr:DUF3489 domain-containing protein [Magnetococcales bacterium]
MKHTQKLSGTQESIIYSAILRLGKSIHPLPYYLNGAPAKKVLAALRSKGYIDDKDIVTQEGIEMFNAFRKSKGVQEVILMENSEPLTEPTIVSIAETMAEPMPETMAEPMPETMAEPMPETMAEPMPETMAEPMPETMAEPMPETMAEPMPETMAEPMPETMAEPIAADEPAGDPAADAPASDALAALSDADLSNSAFLENLKEFVDQTVSEHGEKHVAEPEICDFKELDLDKLDSKESEVDEYLAIYIPEIHKRIDMRNWTSVHNALVFIREKHGKASFHHLVATTEALKYTFNAGMDQGKTYVTCRSQNGTKKAKVIEMIMRPEGVTLDEIFELTKWQPHSIRGFISTIKKDLGIEILVSKEWIAGAKGKPTTTYKGVSPQGTTDQATELANMAA